MYIQRFLEPIVAEHLESTPVVIIEGARAVGKTRLLGALREAGVVRATFSMTDPTQLAAASENPLAWLRALPSPFAVDEAQLVDGLPLAIKALLDETEEQVRIVLTGSAAIGRTGLGGTDPLARRSVRLTLEPLSEAELHGAGGQAWSLIDQLFDGTPAVIPPSAPKAGWQDCVVRGGLPKYRVKQAHRAPGALHRQIDQDIRSILTDDVLPGERWDTRSALDVLNHLLMHPGGELNATAISKSLGLDVRTVNRYIDILERRFLVEEIPNFHRPSKKSPRSTAKCYPADTALSGAAMLATDRTLEDAATRGGLMETHVVQQIRAHLGWAATGASLTHWRENRGGRTSEVDLVIQDSQGRLVAVEIKSSGSATSGHFQGVRAFKRYYGERFHRGFVIHAGDQMVAFDDDLWALPWSSLWDRDAWAIEVESKTVDGPPLVLVPKSEEDATVEKFEEAKIFISYTHKDQQSSTGGDIRRFAADVVDAMEGIHGRAVRSFLDTSDGQWGELLWGRLDEELQASTFFMPFITPRYLKSESCRREFLRFSEASQRNDSEQLLLPLVWITPPSFKDSESGDPIVQRLRDIRYQDVTSARRAGPGSPDYAALVERVADSLEGVMASREEIGSPDGNSTAVSRESSLQEAGFDDYLAEVERLTPRAESDLNEFVEDFQWVAQEFEKAALAIQAQTPTQLRDSMARISSELRGPNEKLTASSANAARTWDELITNLNRGTKLYLELNGGGAPEDLIEPLQAIVDQLRELDTAQVEGVAHQMPMLSSQLVPTSRSLLSAINTLRSIESMLSSWLSEVAPGDAVD